MLRTLPLTLLLACAGDEPPKDTASPADDTADTDDTETDTGDSETGDTDTDTGDADTADTADTDTDSGDTDTDTGDTDTDPDTGDTDPVDSGDTDSGETGDPDADADGYSASEDCDDGDAWINPAADEACDGIDNDCDTLVDDDDHVEDYTGGVVGYADLDLDGYGLTVAAALYCELPVATSATDGDCDDDDAAIHPDATETCDGIDDDCDELVDDEDEVGDYTGGAPGYTDADADGYGDDTTEAWYCELPEGLAAEGADCDDADASVHPDGTEVCGGADDDCDGLVDDDDTVDDYADGLLGYADADGDSFGLDTSTAWYCELPTGWAVEGGDCDDADGTTHPDATEACDTFDNDCDGLVDDDDEVGEASGASYVYEDHDGDLYGDDITGAWSCSPSTTSVTVADDCDDTDASIHPGATEVCDDVDADCDLRSSGCDVTCSAGEDPASWDCDGSCNAYDASAGPDCDEVCEPTDSSVGPDCVGAPVVEVTPSSPGTDDDLVASSSVSGATWEWTVDGVTVSAVAGLDTVPASLTTRGEVWTARATGGGLTGYTSVTIGNTVPTLTVALTPSEPGTDDVLTVDLDGEDADGDTITYTYTWSVNGTVVAETGDSLDGAVWFDEGDTVSVSVTPGDGYGEGTAASDTVEVPSSCTVLSFDGGDVVSLPSTSAWAFTGAFTVEIWAYADTITSSRRLLSTYWDNGWRYNVTSSTRLRFAVNEGSYGQVAFDYGTGAWHHLASVYDGAGTLTVYVDGVSVGSASARSPDATTGAAYIGATSGGSYGWTGMIGPTRMSRVARYTSTFTPDWGWSADSDTLAAWNFEEGTGATLNDETGTYDGTISGATWTTITCP